MSVDTTRRPSRSVAHRAERVAERAAALSAAARATAARSQAKLLAVQQRHADVVGSHTRLTILRWRARVEHVLVHPLDSATYALRLAAHHPSLADLTAGLHAFLNRETPLDDGAQIEAETGPEGDIRSLGILDIRGTEHQAILAHPPARLRWRARGIPGGAVVARAALVPQTWLTNVGGVEFQVSVTDARGRTVSRSLRVEPARHWRHRMWQTLHVPLWPDLDGDVDVDLTTRLPDDARGDYAWAVWGSPALIYQRPYADVTRSIRSALQSHGLGGALRRLVEMRPVTPDVERYRAWCAAVEPGPARLEALAAEVASWSARPRFSIITPVHDTPRAVLEACIESVRRQVYPDWELCLADDGSTRPETLAVLETVAADPRIRLTRLDQSGHICAASNAALALATGDYVVTLDHDDALPADALAEVARAIRGRPDADFVYSDEDKLDESGRRVEPHFKPDWSPELFHTYMYTCHLLVARRSLVVEIGGFREGMEGAQDYDLVLRLLGRTSNILHVPRILYHWRKSADSTAAAQQAKPWAVQAGRRALEEHLARIGADAEVGPGMAPGLYRVRHRIEGTPLVSLVILAGGRTRRLGGREVDLLANTVRSIAQKTTYRHYELVIVDDGVLPAESGRVLADLPHRRVSYSHDGPFNFSRKANFAVAQARGSHVVLLNDDLEVISSEWLSAMLEFSQQPGVGAVGARLLFPDGRLQHVGMLIGVNGVAAHALHMFPGSHAGYFGSAITIRNCSAVTAACLMTRREVFEEVGGFDESLAVDFNDVDLCLRIRQLGYRIVYTPYAQLYHLESSSIGNRVQNQEEINRMRERWAAVLADGDPYYNRNLTRQYLDYRLGTPARRATAGDSVTSTVVTSPPPDAGTGG